jgi:hypothetical protein
VTELPTNEAELLEPLINRISQIIGDTTRDRRTTQAGYRRLTSMLNMLGHEHGYEFEVASAAVAPQEPLATKK